jgi:cytochrome c-type biogenesis protein CcmE
MYQAGNKNKIHVVGQLKKDNTGNVVGIETSADMLSFKFTMLDEHNIEQVVFHPNPMPTDFLRSEQVVVVGAYQNEKFVADKILLKCPSKYQEEGIKV